MAGSGRVKGQCVRIFVVWNLCWCKLCTHSLELLAETLRPRPTWYATPIKATDSGRRVKDLRTLRVESKV